MDTKNRNRIKELSYIQNMFIHLFRKLLSKCCDIFTDNDKKFHGQYFKCVAAVFGP